MRAVRARLPLGSRAGQRSQAMTEFALVAPLLLLMIFGIVDFGRIVYIQATLNQAANEAARVAIRGEPPNYSMASDVDVETAAKVHAQGVYLANPCPNGPIPSNPVPPANQGWVFITEAPAPTVYESSPPGNAPGLGAAGPGQTAPPFTGSCNRVVPAAGNQPLQITVYYNFVPLTPLIRQVTADRIVLKAYAVYRTEY